ncbi:unnamed protein product [Enterobius vermicularis]|uniref:glucuronosyltransferase n=1 Tax=Enterobius vermicularis TaxID=51028 RepID=A0A0N4VQ96_ENTVE|nr:unnamed protein product [Enterobius vermicularis]
MVHVCNYRFMTSPETELFRKYVDPDFPRLEEVASTCPLVMVNFEELYALPRPMLHKVVYIGGLGITERSVGQFKVIADKASNIIVFLFGSIANASEMPSSWKNAFLNSFRSFPHIEFITRYDGEDLQSKLPQNVHTYEWLPQTDLLPLITHAGHNSIIEAVNAGVPMIAIPLFVDQPMNALLAEKRHFGILLQKSQVSEEALKEAIKTLTEDESYAKAVKHVQKMIQKKPSKPEELLVRWTEYVGKFKDLSNLTPYSVKLNFIQYYSIDVIFFIVLVLSLIIIATFKISLFIVTCLRKLFLLKKEKTS